MCTNVTTRPTQPTQELQCQPHRVVTEVERCFYAGAQFSSLYCTFKTLQNTEKSQMSLCEQWEGKTLLRGRIEKKETKVTQATND